MKLAYALATLLLATVSIPSFAQTARVHGEIEKLDHSVLTVKTQDDGVINIKLNNDASVIAMTKASLADITAREIHRHSRPPRWPQRRISGAGGAYF